MSTTLFIIILSSVVSIAAWQKNEIFDKLKLNPYMIVHKNEYQRIIGHGFIHVDWSHLIFNMITLYFFGDLVEQKFAEISNKGNLIYISFYLIAIAISSIPSILKNKNNHYYNSVGASGAVSAVLFASIIFMPKNELFIPPIPVPIPGYIFGILYLIVSHYLGKKNADNINHDAHITGAIFGIIFPIILKPSLINHFVNSISS